MLRKPWFPSVDLEVCSRRDIRGVRDKLSNLCRPGG